MLDDIEIPAKLPNPLWRKMYIIRELYRQQYEMHKNKQRRCDDRIVSIHQPHVRPVIRGKANKNVEFGAKLSVSLDKNGIACMHRIGWDVFNEGGDLEAQVEAYKAIHGYYPEVLLADTIYGTRANRKYLKSKEIRFGGKPLGRPKKLTESNREELIKEKAQRTKDYRERIPIEGKFGQGKNGYGLSKVRI